MHIYVYCTVKTFGDFPTPHDGRSFSCPRRRSAEGHGTQATGAGEERITGPGASIGSNIGSEASEHKLSRASLDEDLLLLE